MRIDTHSVVYFINEEYGVVIRANGATKEVAMWERKRECFAKRLDLLTASFLVRTDRFEGKWCAAHPTYRLLTAKAAAKRLTPKLPNADGMRLAQTAKLDFQRKRLREGGAAAVLREIEETWNARETKYAAT